MKRIGRIGMAVIVAVLTIFTSVAYAGSLTGTGSVQEVTNPMKAVSSVYTKGMFTVSITPKTLTDMQAFKYVINYDVNKLKVLEASGTGYGFFEEFNKRYNADSNAVFACNNVVDGAYSHVIFTGAQAEPANAVTPADMNIAYVNFVPVREPSGEAAFLELVSSVNLMVEHLEGESGSLVPQYPEVFAVPVAVETGSGFFVDTLVRGDVSLNQKVNLEDAQLALKAALGILKLSPQQIRCADMDSNGGVTLVDANMILKLALGIKL